MTNEEIKAMIEGGLPQAEAHVSGDGTHFVAKVISDAFAGLSLLKQHRLVYGALGDSMQSAIHALSIQTYTVAEWERQKAFRTL
jgi:acid stress-induced BolA-like protein IbaG/YrbA